MRISLGKLENFQREGIHRVFVNGLDLILIKKNGEFFCLENRCSHEDFPLEDGDLDEHNGVSCVVCPAHGAKFSFSGQALTLPAVENIKSYKIEIAEGEVFATLNE